MSGIESKDPIGSLVGSTREFTDADIKRIRDVISGRDKCARFPGLTWGL